MAELFVTLGERVTGGQQGGTSTPFPQLRGPSCGMLCLGTPGRSKPAQNDAEKCAGFYTHWISIAPLPKRSILGLTDPTGLEGA